MATTGASGAGGHQGWPWHTEFAINPSVCTQDVLGDAGGGGLCPPWN